MMVPSDRPAAHALATPGMYHMQRQALRLIELRLGVYHEAKDLRRSGHPGNFCALNARIELPLRVLTFCRMSGWSAMRHMVHTRLAVLASWLANRKSITVSAIAWSVTWPGGGTPCCCASATSSRQRCAQKSIRHRGSPPACTQMRAIEHVRNAEVKPPACTEMYTVEPLRSAGGAATHVAEPGVPTSCIEGGCH
jgi:hypothetical protein